MDAEANLPIKTLNTRWSSLACSVVI
uniref:Uncharacterized protein n=1 Tax=Rhizophora mucronata TaxID=61149 RepID=A0A2P2K4H1_RHIMU